MTKMIQGRKGEILASLFSDMVQESQTKEGKNFFNTFTSYFYRKSKKDKSGKVFKGTVTKIN